MGLNVAILAGVISFVFINSHGSSVAPTLMNATAEVNPLDRPTSVDIAASVANLANLPEAPVVNGQALAEKVQQSSSALVSGSTVAVKAQVVKSAYASNKDITVYTVQPGDTVSSLAIKFGVSSSSIKWSNGLSGDSLPVGKTLYIPPVDGIVYTVKSSDTPESLAQTYAANKDLIIAYNDAELKGLSVGERIILPGATMPTPTYGGYAGFYSYFANIAGNYNMYDRNNCTWWVAYRWAQVGHPIMPLLGNASQWYYNAQRAGLGVGHTPQQYAAAVTSFAGYGHVVFIEGINSDGSVNISEMNVDGRATSQVWRTTESAATAATWSYIYP